jgi:hypothetical protein
MASTVDRDRDECPGPHGTEISGEPPAPSAPPHCVIQQEETKDTLLRNTM